MLKLIKDKNENIIKPNTVGQFIRIKNEDYVLQDNEEVVIDANIIEYCHNYNMIDYRKKREVFKFLAQTFAEQNDDIKESICKYCVMNNMSIIGYYMSQGLSQMEATQKYIFNLSQDIVNSAANLDQYMSSQAFIQTIISFLPLSESERFLRETKDLQYFYRTACVFGKKYGDNQDGILDYIESYGTYENLGLKTYTLYPGLLLSDFVNKMVDVLVNGNI